jgi:hypothetical protein
MYRLIAALSAVSAWLDLEPCKVGGIVPTENLISAKKVKEGSCGNPSLGSQVRDCFACGENSNVSASRA